MTDAPNTITRSTYLQALGLFTVAKRHTEKAEEFSDELCKLLGFNDRNDNSAGHLSDAVWGMGQFDEALKLSGITVTDEPT
jgi:hypothetical protein